VTDSDKHSSLSKYGIDNDHTKFNYTGSKSITKTWSHICCGVRESPLVSSSLASKYYAKMGVVNSDKHSSLPQYRIDNGDKKFYDKGPGS
jgi:hypothetical protein